MEEKPAKQRLQFDFPSELVEDLEKLKNEGRATTRAEVMRNAFRLYKWFANRVEPDFIVEVHDPKGKVVYRITAEMLLS